MEKCSISPLSVRVSVELRPEPRYLRGHKAFSSVGEGCGDALAMSQARGEAGREGAHWKIDSAVIHDCIADKSKSIGLMIRTGWVVGGGAWGRVGRSAYRSSYIHRCPGSWSSSRSVKTRPWSRQCLVSRSRGATGSGHQVAHFHREKWRLGPDGG